MLITNSFPVAGKDIAGNLWRTTLTFMDLSMGHSRAVAALNDLDHY